MSEDEPGYRWADYTWEPEPDGPSQLRAPANEDCAFCASPETVWQHDLNASRATWRAPGDKGMTWRQSLSLCGPCECLYQDGDYLALARRDPSYKPRSPMYFKENQLASIAAFCRADRGPQRQT